MKLMLVFAKNALSRLGNASKTEYIVDDSRDYDDNYLDKCGNIKKTVTHEKSQVAPNLSQEGEFCVTDELCRHLGVCKYF